MRYPPLVSVFLFAAPAVFIVAGLAQRQHIAERIELEARNAERLSVDRRRMNALLEMRRDTKGAIDFIPTFNPQAPYRMTAPEKDAANAIPAYTFDVDDDYWGLPRADGVGLIASHCTGCHSLEIVMQQRMTKDRWAYTLDWMVEKQGMAPFDADQYEIAFAYLTTYFASEDTMSDSDN